MGQLYEVKRDEDRRIATRGSFEIFATYYLAHLMFDEPPKFHTDLYDLFMPGRKTPRVMRMLDIEPRAHGKSVRWSIAYPLWLLCTNPYNLNEKQKPVDIVCISNTSTKAEDFLRAVGVELETNVRLKADWGDMLKGAKVNNNSDKILNNGRRIRAKGSGAQIRGDHPTDVIIDDLEDREEAQNADLRDKMEKYVRQDLLGALEDRTSMVIVGTIVHEQGLLNSFWKDDRTTQGWVMRKFSAINDDGTALWPSHWSLEKLERKRQEMGDLAFSQEYLNLPLPSENPAIRPDWIQYVDSMPERFDLQCVTAVDPAFSEKTESDYSAVVTIGVQIDGANKGKVYVVDRERGHWSPSDTCRTAIGQAVRWKSDILVMEGVAGAVAMIDLLATMKRQRNVNFTTKLVKPTRLLDKVSRAQSVAHLFESGRVYFKKTQRDIVEELLLLPNGKNDDMADAVVWALREANNTYIRPMHKKQYRSKIDDSVGIAGY